MVCYTGGMRILHTSDLHGDVDHIRRLIAANTRWDIWVDTGDFCPNFYVPLSLGDMSHMVRHGVRADRQGWLDQLCEDLQWDQVAKGRIEFQDAVRAAEAKAQAAWVENVLKDRLLPLLAGRPAIFLPGNHDFVEVGTLLTQHQLWPEAIQIGDYRFAGFPHVTYFQGEYNFETQDRSAHIQRALAQNPTILCTHIPPQGILSDQNGCTSLANALFYQNHEVLAHLFGHCHSACGTETVGDIFFSNAATTGRVLTL